MELAKLKFDPSIYINRKISTQPELLMAFLKDKKTVVARVYYALKFLDKQGAGILPVDFVKSVFCTTDNICYLMSFQQLKKILDEYNNKLWIYANDKIVIYSPAKVANYFDLPKFACKSVSLDCGDIFGKLAYFNSACYGAYITTLGDVPTSRSTILEQTGVTASTQIRYEKMRGIELKAAVVSFEKAGTRPKKLYEYKEQFQKRVTEVFNENGESEYHRYKRIGNIRNHEGMIKTDGSRRRRAINANIDRVEQGRQNLSSNSVKGQWKKVFNCVIHGDDWCMAANTDKNFFVETTIKVAYKLRSSGVIQRIPYLGHMPCIVFDQFSRGLIR